MVFTTITHCWSFEQFYNHTICHSKLMTSVVVLTLSMDCSNLISNICVTYKIIIHRPLLIHLLSFILIFYWLLVHTVHIRFLLQNATDELSVSVPLLNPENSLVIDSVLLLDDCKAACIATVPRGNLCSNLDKVVEYDVPLTFWTYLSVRVFIGMISGTAFAMFEGKLHFKPNKIKSLILFLHCKNQ